MNSLCLLRITLRGLILCLSSCVLLEKSWILLSNCGLKPQLDLLEMWWHVPEMSVRI